MKKMVNYLGLATALLLMATAVLTYLAPHLGWRILDMGFVTEFLKTLLGFVLFLVMPTLIFIAVYIRIIRQFLNRDKSTEPLRDSD